MEQFRQIGGVLGSMNALMILQERDQLNKRQCSLLFDMFKLAFDVLSEEIKQNLRLEEKYMKWKVLEQPLKELYRVYKEAELYLKQCMDSKDWWVKVLYFHNNQDCVEFHIHNLLCYFAIVVESIETAGEISGLDLDDMKKKRMILGSKYDMKWDDPKLFMWKYGKQYLISEEISSRMCRAQKEDKWVLLEMMEEKKLSSICRSNKEAQRLSEMFTRMINEEDWLCDASVLRGWKDYQVRRRLGGGKEYKEMQWLGESLVLRKLNGECSLLNKEICSLVYLSHPNIVQYLCGFHDEEKNEYLVVMEQMSKDLRSYIKEVCGLKRRRLPFAFPGAVDMMLQIARGMEFLHSKKIYHGDLNTANVFIKPRNPASDQAYFQAKVSGFGLNDVKTVSSRSTSPNRNDIVPFIWHAPEVLTEQEMKYSEKADVYSFGMLCFELLTGKLPFQDGHLQGDQMSRNIKAGERPLFPFALPKYLATLIKKCWQTHPIHRPTFSSICRILRYVKRLILINPHLAQPEIPSILQLDLCDLESGFLNKFPSHPSSVSQIPFQLFSYRLAEKQKKLYGRDKDWETHSEVLISSPMADMLNVLDGSFSPVHGTKSVCLDITDQKRHSVFRRVSGKAKDDQFLQAQDTLSVSSEISEKKVPILRKSNSVAEGNSSSLRNQAKSVCIEIPEQKTSSLKKCNTLPFMKRLDESRSPSSDVPAKKVLDKKVPPLRKSNSSRTSRDSGKPKERPSFFVPRGSTITAEKQLQPSVPQKSSRTKHKHTGLSPDNSS
ncbi:uncharacterized protein LOC130803043 [Amaranthus tricolor]|uniref:uncharacterized protein LOC130803043 n=1 Tax=Amaranthus tricolor TaxID=29722 RepID=UPI002587D8AD|nr:uncharacterized protein LOC130803043 [Amaranthus tricolor]